MNMRKKKNACTAFVITLFSISTAYAQKGLVVRHDSAAIRMRWEERRPQLKTDLQLTDAQADSIVVINIEFQYKRDTVFSDWHLDTRDKMSHYQSLMQVMNGRLQAALGNDLFTKYETWLHEHSKSPYRKSSKEE
jgi:hypothetical protein